MKYFIALLGVMYSVLSFSQSTFNPDTVCYQTPGSVYQVTNDPGNIYTWSVSSPGILVSGQGTNSIVVDWSNASPGLITNGVSVFPTNQFGCVGPTVDINVYILNVVLAIFPLELCENEPCETLSASPTGGEWSGIGIVGDEFCPSISGVGVFTSNYTYTLAGCTFTTTGINTVHPTPTITPITHN